MEGSSSGDRVRDWLATQILDKYLPAKFTAKSFSSNSNWTISQTVVHEARNTGTKSFAGGGASASIAWEPGLFLLSELPVVRKLTPFNTIALPAAVGAEQIGPTYRQARRYFDGEEFL